MVGGMEWEGEGEDEVGDWWHDVAERLGDSFQLWNDGVGRKEV